jgi:hypothetical protein
MHRVSVRSLAVVIIALVLTFAGTSVRAGTTGGIHGVVTADGAPLANVRVAVESPSQQAVAFTDRNGSYNFLSLAPDTYTVTVQKQGYAPQKHTDVEVTADAQAEESFDMEKALQGIGDSEARYSVWNGRRARPAS